MKELEYLLDHYWIRKEDDKELFYSIKDSLPALKPFLAEKLGYHVLVTPDLIKLEKYPGRAESWMGIESFQDPMAYAFLCLLLMFLEDIGNEEQFVLSSVTDFIQANFPEENKVDWTLYRQRRHLIDVMRFAARLGMILVDDGNDLEFANSGSSEVLYESTGLSRYFVRSFTSSIMDYSSYHDIENEDFADIDRDRGVLRRHRVYRRLVMTPVVYNEGAEDSDYGYIKNFRSMLEKDFETYLNASLHVHRNGAMLVFPQNCGLADTFPNSRAISDIVLQINGCIVNGVRDNVLTRNSSDVITVSRSAFLSMLRKVREECGWGWSKEYREMTFTQLQEEIIAFMKDYGLICESPDGKELALMPLCGKVVGGYPGNADIMSDERRN